jgi:hypothetical protein
VAFEGGKASKDGDHQLPMWRCGITPGISQTFETSSTLSNASKDIQQIPS